MKNFAKDLHVKDDLLFLDNKLVVPAVPQISPAVTLFLDNKLVVPEKS